MVLAVMTIQCSESYISQQYFPQNKKKIQGHLLKGHSSHNGDDFCNAYGILLAMHCLLLTGGFIIDWTLVTN